MTYVAVSCRQTGHLYDCRKSAQVCGVVRSWWFSLWLSSWFVCYTLIVSPVRLVSLVLESYLLFILKCETHFCGKLVYTRFICFIGLWAQAWCQCSRLKTSYAFFFEGQKIFSPSHACLLSLQHFRIMILHSFQPKFQNSEAAVALRSPQQHSSLRNVEICVRRLKIRVGSWAESTRRALADSGVSRVREERTVDPCSRAQCEARGRGDETSVSTARRVGSWEHKLHTPGSGSGESTKLDLRS